MCYKRPNNQQNEGKSCDFARLYNDSLRLLMNKRKEK